MIHFHPRPLDTTLYAQLEKVQWRQKWKTGSDSMIAASGLISLKGFATLVWLNLPDVLDGCRGLGG